MEAVNDHRRFREIRTSAEILKLVREFESCSLPRALWTHHAHLLVALCYLMQYERTDATFRIREGIKRYNKACGVETTRTSGYHETLTLFYIQVVRRFLSKVNSDCTLAALANALVNSCGDRSLPLEYYSRERLMSWEARTKWLEPDLKALE